MGVIEKAISWMEALARDDSHGYDQEDRWGEYGDYDCSSAVITAWEQAGVPVKSAGATYTGNMYSIFKSKGFNDVTNQVNRSTGDGLQRGDVLLNVVNHVAMYCGNGQMVEASINEYGGITGGQPGDQTGREIRIGAYRNYPWEYVLRYSESGNATESNKTVTEPSKSQIQVNVGKDLNKSYKWTGVVMADELNVRQWAGTEYGTCSFSPLYYGQQISVCDSIYAADHSIWHYILYKGKYGFVHSDYVGKV